MRIVIEDIDGKFILRDRLTNRLVSQPFSVRSIAERRQKRLNAAYALAERLKRANAQAKLERTQQEVA